MNKYGKIKKGDDMHNKTEKEIFAATNSSIEGLTSEEALKRQTINGLNVLPKQSQETIFKIFLTQLCDPIIYILIVSIVLSFILKEYIDGIFIIIVIFVDAILGTFQEWRANKSALKLKEIIKEESICLRNRQWQTVNSESLVVGDIVKIESGTRISAD